MNKNIKIGIKENKHVNNLVPEHNSTNYEEEFFSLESFKNLTSIEIKSCTEEELVFNFIGIDAPLINALRRILISEIPTIAIENCIFYQNTSIMPDEVLAHRLGLIPIQADANYFNYKNENEDYNEYNNLVFKLHVICKNEPIDVMSSDIKWIPQSNQKNRLTNIKLVHDDIIITKLSPGQEIEIELIAVKGIGKTHAKWSPVCTAYYRLIPSIEIKQTIKGEKAEAIKKICPMGVFDIEDTGKLFVSNSNKCTMCRECLRSEVSKDDIILSKLRNSYECKKYFNFSPY